MCYLSNKLREAVGYSDFTTAKGRFKARPSAVVESL